MPPNESCTEMEEDIVIYSRDFGIGLSELINKDESNSHSKTRF